MQENINKREYKSPSIEVISKFKEATHGVWFGKHTDAFGGKAPICVHFGDPCC